MRLTLLLAFVVLIYGCATSVEEKCSSDWATPWKGDYARCVRDLYQARAEAEANWTPPARVPTAFTPPASIDYTCLSDCSARYGDALCRKRCSY